MVKITKVDSVGNEEFRDCLKDYCLYTDTTSNNNKYYSYSNTFRLITDLKEKKLPLSELYLFKEWLSGGLTGGSCWGDNADTPVDSEKEPDFTEIEDILIKFIPDISFLRYKKILRLVEYGEYTNSEYYGNYTNYNYKIINLGKLFDSLNE